MNFTPKRLLVVGIAVTMVLSMVPGGALAQDSGEPNVNLENLVEIYNANVEDAPGIARGRFAGETLEVRVGSGDTVAKKDTGDAYHFTTNSDGEITDYGDGSAESPSIRVRTSESAFRAIIDAEDPAKEFNEQYEAGNIKVNGLTITKAVEVELAKFAAWLGKTFGLF